MQLAFKQLGADVLLGPIVAAYEIPTLEHTTDPFQSLTRAIIHQQLSGKAAATINARFIALFGDVEHPSPVEVSNMKFEDLRSAGLSGQKAGYIQDLARHFVAGSLSQDLLLTGSNDEIRAHLIEVKGIGHWSVDMYLMFSVCRLDVFPTGDLGIQNALRKLLGREDKIKPAEMEAVAEPWRPYRTAAALYLWRSLENR